MGHKRSNGYIQSPVSENDSSANKEAESLIPQTQEAELWQQPQCFELLWIRDWYSSGPSESH